MRRRPARAASAASAAASAASVNGIVMTENLDLDLHVDLLLAEHDPAPARAFTPAETVRQETLLRDILDGRSAPARSSQRPAARWQRRLAISLAASTVLAVAACAGAVLLVPDAVQHARNLISHGTVTVAEPMFSSADLASWTSAATPATTGGPGAQWCDRALQDAPGNGSPQTVTDADLRGRIASEIVLRAGHVFLCMAGTQGQGFWDTLDPVPAHLGAGTVLVDTSGAHGVGITGDAGFAYASGFAGGDVRSVILHSAGHNTTALIQGRRWTAWWPIASFRAYAPQHDTVTIDYADGTTRTVAESTLFQNQ